MACGIASAERGVWGLPQSTQRPEGAKLPGREAWRVFAKVAADNGACRGLERGWTAAKGRLRAVAAGDAAYRALNQG